jgi:NAD-dependent dihydropyrimidine dehydrogenase PreA subunit
MRNKELGWDWGGFAWKMHFSDGSEKVIPQAKVPYMQGFLGNIFLRPSCYRCAVKPSKVADITLGDFWGIRHVNDQMPARYGVSAVILHTKAGEDAFSSVLSEVETYEVTYKDILPNNLPLATSVAKPVYRSYFFKKFLSNPDGDIAELIADICAPSFLDKVINKAYKTLPQRSVSVRDLKAKGERVVCSAKERCCGCGACYNACPTNAIFMKKDREGFLYPVIDQKKCIDCGVCISVCPFAPKK